MSSLEYPFVLGTAGHIDHGKTALVRSLSGIDCDRLSEEKKRGMTIELGFAPLLLPSGRTVSVVDVPGHEKFIRQMVAGAAGVDAIMLVVAADDGVMPQTREHLEILTLLGVKNGLTVINKIDLVDEEMLELAKDEIISLTEGTFLEGAPLLPVSALNGEGIPELLAEIDQIVSQSVQKDRAGAFFMPVDRAFHMSGFGTVVTGTALRGSLSEGDDIEMMPAGEEAKVRSLQVHGENVKTAFAGQRVAVNIAGASLQDVARGDVLAAKGTALPTSCVDVLVEVLPSYSEPIEHWQRIRFHVGTSDTVARISLIDRERILPGETAPAQILTEETITTSHDAKFIIRTYSPLKTAAGGRVLLPAGERPKNKETKASLVSLLERFSKSEAESEKFAALLDYKEVMTHFDALSQLGWERKYLSGTALSLESKGMLGIIKCGTDVYISPRKMDVLNVKLQEKLEKFHRTHPERKGMNLEEISKALFIRDTRFLKELLKLFRRKSWINFDDERAALIDFEPFDETKFLGSVIELTKAAAEAGYSMLTVDEARKGLGVSEKEMTRIITFLKERKEVNIIGEGYLLFSKTEEDLLDKLAKIEGEITLAGVRDLTNSSRKYILPLLEYFDSRGITRRVGDKRLLLKRK